MKIPFDIKFRPQIESGEYKVETRGGRSARIICWDAVIFSSPSKKPKGIIALVKDENGAEEVFHYFDNGKPWLEDTLADLFIVTPEPELPEFEKKLADVVSYAISSAAVTPEKPTAEFVKDYAKELLELAKAEALKDLPRWKKAERDIASTEVEFAVLTRVDGGDYKDHDVVTASSRILKGEYYFDLGDLIKLPKDEID